MRVFDLIPDWFAEKVRVSPVANHVHITVDVPYNDGHVLVLYSRIHEDHGIIQAIEKLYRAYGGYCTGQKILPVPIKDRAWYLYT